MIVLECAYCGSKVKRSGVKAERWAKAFCNHTCQKLHTERTQEERRTAILVGAKTCPKCDTLKNLSEFYKDSRLSTGFACWCKACHNTSVNRSREERVEKDPAREREMTLRRLLQRKYGVDLEHFKSLSAAQDGRCAICRREGSQQSRKHRLYVDHCHDTGRIRGLLCHPCNVALGLLGESVERVKAAVTYLEKQSLQGAILTLAEGER